MATATYIPIATQTLGSAAASITFSSIPGTYTDLRLVLTAQQSVGNQPYISISTNFGITYLIGNGSTATSSNVISTSGFGLLAGSSNAAQPYTSIVDFFSYAGSTYKTILIQTAQDVNGSGNVELAVAMHLSTAAITTFTISTSGGNFNAGTIATLFGI